MKFDDLAKIDPKNLDKNLREALKGAKGVAVDLTYLFGRTDKKSKAKKPSVVLVGEVTTGLVKSLKDAEEVTVHKGKLADTDDTILFQVQGSALTEKALTVLLMNSGIRKKTKLVDDVEVALAEGAPGGKKAEPEQHPKPEAPEDPLLKAADAKYKAMKPRLVFAEKIAQENYASRFDEMKKAVDKCLVEKNGKDAAKLVVALEKMVDDVTRSHELTKDGYEAQIKELAGRLSAFKKPALHAKHIKEVGDSLTIVGKSIQELKVIEPRVLDAYIETARTVLDDTRELVPAFRSGAADLAELDAQLVLLADDVEKVRKSKKSDLQKLESFDEKAHAKKPDVLLKADPFTPFTAAIDAREALLKFVRANAPKDVVDTETDPVKRRQKVYVYNNPATWELMPVSFKNSTSATDIGGAAATLATASLSSNTTAGGKVLKANYEGHAHLDGGGGGVAFVYVRNADYTVTPTVVDTSSKRGGKNGNQYSWNTGGVYDYFPPNASY